MLWNEVAKITVRGARIAAKDGMIMIGEDEVEPVYPFVTVEPGTFVAEIHLSEPWHCARFRLRRTDADPERGSALGSIDIDSGRAAFIDYDSFHAAVCADADSYEAWTAGALDDELALNFSGKIAFGETELVYAKSADGDGRYATCALVDGGVTVGMECVFEQACRG